MINLQGLVRIGKPQIHKVTLALGIMVDHEIVVIIILEMFSTLLMIVANVAVA